MVASGWVTSLPRRAIKALALPPLRARFRRDIRLFTAPYRLHLGCGSYRLQGWVNIDFIHSPAVDVWWNLGWPIPLPDGSCRYIFHEHVLEHFELWRGLDLLRECHRLLQPGGVLRVAMPSLDHMLALCASGDWRTHRSPHMPETKTRAEFLNMNFRYWGHQWIYDREELNRRLREAGFRAIVDVERHRSDHLQLRGVEHREDSLLICEAIKTAERAEATGPLR
jgi:predicted SAM-dependent methyltransferase